VRGRTSCAGEEKKIKRSIIGEGSSTAQEGGAQQNYVLQFGGIPAPPSYLVVYQCKHGGVVQPCPTKFAVSNVAFAEPYAHLPQPQKIWPSLEDTLRETCKLLQPSKPMQIK
jgi:hypothetical protein